MAKIEENIKESSNINNEILERLNKLEAENKSLAEKLAEKKENMFTKAKKEYKGPRLYNYKKWGGIPVLGYVSKKKDNTKDWLTENKYGVYDSNHFLILTLANKKVVEVEVNEFNRSFTRSEKQECKVISDGVSTTGYIFNDEEFGEFTVNTNIIN